MIILSQGRQHSGTTQGVGGGRSERGGGRLERGGGGGCGGEAEGVGVGRLQGHKWTLNRITLARGRQSMVGTAPETTERTSCPAMKILVLGPEINLLLL